MATQAQKDSLAKARAAKGKGTKERVMIIARNTETIKEQYASANGVNFPFETPVWITPNQKKALERQKEPIQVAKSVSVHDLMQQHQCSVEKAQELAKLIQENPNQGGKKITYVSRYILQKV